MRNKNIKNVKQWKASNGNVCFSLMCQMRSNRLFKIMLVVLCAMLVYGILCLIFEKLILYSPIVFLIFVFSLWILKGIAERDEAIIETTVLQIMDNAVDEDAKAAGANVIKRLVTHDTKGTYGVVESSCLLVLLDNGVVWEYPLVYHKTEDGAEYIECKRNYIVIDNQKYISKISAKGKVCFKWTEKTRLGLLLATILVGGGLILVGIVSLVVCFKWQCLLVLLGYLCVYFLMRELNGRITNRTLQIIKNVISIPIPILYLVFQIITPVVVIVGAYLAVTAFTFFVPAAMLILITHLEIVSLKVETIVFIVFSVGSIVCSHSYKITKRIIHSTPLRNFGNHTYEFYKEQLAIYLIHPSNFIFLLYLIYFSFLGISGYLQIEEDRYLVSQGIDAAILKAFLVFIAFTNMRLKAKSAKLDVRELYQRTMKLFVSDK